MLKAKIARELAQAAHYEATSVLAGAKAGTEDAKQGNLRSDTDLKNLDFVEQESGVKQERDLQKQADAAKHQGQLQSMKHAETMDGKKHDMVKDLLLKKKGTRLIQVTGFS